MSFSIRPIREKPASPPLTKRALVTLEKIITPVWGLSQLVRRKHDVDREQRENHVGILKRVLAVLVGVLFAGLLLVGTLKVLLALRVISLSQLFSAAGEQLPVDAHGHTNLLLLGEGDSDHEGTDLTDTLIVASIDATRKQGVVLLSLPRDLYVLHTEEMGKGRINSLYRNYKGALMAKGIEQSAAESQSLAQLGKEIGTLLGQDIHGVLKIDFSGFVDAVDAIGGIDVVVPQDLVDTEYPGPNYSYETFSINAGPQHLDGATALKYARTRHSTSDFSRSGRQQQILSAALERAQSTGVISNPGKLMELFGIVSTNFRTTLSSRQLLGLAALGKSLRGGSFVSIQLNDQNGLYGSLIEPGGFLYSPPREEFEGAAVLLPVSIPEFPVTWKQIRTFTDLVFGRRELFTNAPAIAVLNAGAKEGVARKLGGELYRYMFNIVTTKNYDKQSTPLSEHAYITMRTAVAADATPEQRERIERTKATAAYLSTLLQIPVTEQTDAAALVEGADIAIVLTKEFSYQALQDLQLPQ